MFEEEYPEGKFVFTNGKIDTDGHYFFWLQRIKAAEVQKREYFVKGNLYTIVGKLAEHLNTEDYEAVRELHCEICDFIPGGQFGVTKGKIRLIDTFSGIYLDTSSLPATFDVKKVGRIITSWESGKLSSATEEIEAYLRSVHIALKPTKGTLLGLQLRSEAQPTRGQLAIVFPAIDMLIEFHPNMPAVVQKFE